MPRRIFSNAGPNAEDKALEVWSDVIIDKLNHLSKNAKWEQPWFDKEGLAWPQNMSGRPYSGLNAVILKMLAEKNHYEIPVWATFNRLTSLNYQKDPTKGPIPLRDSDGQNLPRVMVNKGEKSTPVGLTVFTVINKDTKQKIPYEEYKEMDAEEQKQYNVYPKMAVYNVFNVAGQTNLKEARPELYEKLKEMSRQAEPQRVSDMWSLPEFDAMVDEQKWICPIHVKDEGKCFYSLSRQIVQIVPKEKFKNGEAYFGNALHEMAHSTDCQLHRIDTNKFGSDDYAKEELHAELSAALVASKYGATRNLKTDSLPYVKSWLDSLHEDPKFIKTVLGDVKKSSYLISEKLEDMKRELEQRKEQGTEQSKEVSAEKQQEQQRNGKGMQDVAAKAAPEPPQEQQEEHRYRGFHR